MTILHLTRANLASLPAIDGKWRDTILKGFTYEQRKSKTKTGELLCSYFIQYRFNGLQRKFRISDASKINVDDARKIAFKLFGQIANGIDPQGVKDAAREQAEKKTFAQAVEEYLAARSPDVREKSLRTMRSYLTGAAYFRPLHKKPIDGVTCGDIQPCLDRISRDSGAPSASRTRSALMSFFTWCLRRGLLSRDGNPVEQTEEPKIEAKSERHLSADEIRTVWNACGDNDYGRIIRLLILTGCRREEIGGLRWSHIDLNAGTLTIPVERSKNHQAHTLPLSAMALEIINAIPRRDGCDFLFGARGEGFKMWPHGKRALLASTGAMEPWRLHDLRHTVSTEMHEIGIDPHIVESVLNHISGHKAGDAGRYNHATYKAQMAQALARWADHVASFISGKPAKVVPIRAA